MRQIFAFVVFLLVNLAGNVFWLLLVSCLFETGSAGGFSVFLLVRGVSVWLLI